MKLTVSRLLIGLAFVVFVGSANAQQMTVQSTSSRVALVIGNGAYAQAPIEKAEEGARAVSDVLLQGGFKVLYLENAWRDDIQRGLATFAQSLERGAHGVIFYSGHAVQYQGRNYLAPLDTRITSADDVRREAIDIDLFVDPLLMARTRGSVVILDASRANPWQPLLTSDLRGLAEPEPVKGISFIFSTAPGKLVSNSPQTSGVFAAQLALAMKTPDLGFEEIVNRTRTAVARINGKEQQVWQSEAAPADLAVLSAAKAGGAKPADSVELSFWNIVKNSSAAADYQAYLDAYPNGQFAAIARSKLGLQPKAPDASASPPAAPRQTAAAPQQAPVPGSPPAASGPAAPTAAPGSAAPPAAPRQTAAAPQQAPSPVAPPASSGSAAPTATPGSAAPPAASRPTAATPQQAPASAAPPAPAAPPTVSRQAATTPQQAPAPAAPSAAPGPAVPPAASRQTAAAPQQAPVPSAPPVAPSFAAPPGGPAAAGATPPASAPSIRDCPTCPELVLIPAGTMTMGAAEVFAFEAPAHEVAIAKPFYMGRREVTFDEWDACLSEGGCQYRPGDSGQGRGPRPASDLDWNDAKAYLAWLSRKTGKVYRLPSEAEWEYAARAGTKTAYYWGSAFEKERANCVGCTINALNKAVATGTFPPNAFGLFDMAGNAAEWVEDCWSDNYKTVPKDGSAFTKPDCRERVLRGGSFNNDQRYVRTAARFKYDYDVRYYTNGFRVLRER